MNDRETKNRNDAETPAVRSNYDKGKEFEKRVEEALDAAKLNYSTQEMNASLEVEKDVYMDHVIRTDGGARVAIVEEKSGGCDEHRQAQVLLEQTDTTIENTLIYVTPDGTMDQFSARVRDTFDRPDTIVLDQKQSIEEKLEALEAAREQNPDLRAVIVCDSDEVGQLGRSLVDSAHAKESAGLAESHAADMPESAVPDRVHPAHPEHEPTRPEAQADSQKPIPQTDVSSHLERATHQDASAVERVRPMVEHTQEPIAGMGESMSTYGKQLRRAQEVSQEEIFTQARLQVSQTAEQLADMKREVSAAWQAVEKAVSPTANTIPSPTPDITKGGGLP